MHHTLRLRRAGIALAGAALLLAGTAGANAAGGPQPGSGQGKARVAAAALANPVTTPGSEVKFIAVLPCRILDTRNTSKALTSTERVFSAVKPYSAQGGRGAGCGIPANAVALQLNLGAISQGGAAGWVKGWSTGDLEPNASLVNYDPSGPVANMVVLPLSGVATFSLKTNRTAQVFADVAGYYVKPLYATIDAEDGLTASVYFGISSGLVGVTRVGVGNYELTFDRNVSNCVPAATDLLFDGARTISADAAFSGDSVVAVSVKNSSTGAPEDTVFNLSLTC